MLEARMSLVLNMELCNEQHVMMGNMLQPHVKELSKLLQ